MQVRVQDMTLHFDLLMIIGLCMIPGGIILGFALMAAMSSQEIGALAGMVPGVIVAIAGVGVFLVGLGMELH